LDELIDSKALKSPRTRKVTYAKDTTLRDKPDFRAKLVAEIKSFDDLSAEAKHIAERLYRLPCSEQLGAM